MDSISGNLGYIKARRRAEVTGGLDVAPPPSVGGEKAIADYIQLFDHDIQLLVSAIKETGAAAR